MDYVKTLLFCFFNLKILICGNNRVAEQFGLKTAATHMTAVLPSCEVIWYCSYSAQKIAKKIPLDGRKIVKNSCWFLSSLKIDVCNILYLLYICRRHLRKSGNSGNAQAIPEMPGLPSIAQAFPEMSRQLQKQEISCI